MHAQVIKVWDMSGKLLAGPVTLTDFFGTQRSAGRFSNAFCAQPALLLAAPCSVRSLLCLMLHPHLCALLRHLPCGTRVKAKHSVQLCSLLDFRCILFPAELLVHLPCEAFIRARHSVQHYGGARGGYTVRCLGT